MQLNTAISLINDTPGKVPVTLSKSFTPMRLCHQQYNVARWQ